MNMQSTNGQAGIVSAPPQLLGYSASISRYTGVTDQRTLDENGGEALDMRLPIDPAKRVTGRMVEWPKGSGKTVERWSNQTDSGQNRLTPGEARWKDRSRTYSGVADAAVDHWCSVLGRLA